MARHDTSPIKTTQWQALRTFAATRANFRCEHCFKYTGMHGEADHIQPRAKEHEHGLHVYDPTNIQWLCTSCHTTKTNVERQREAGRTGEDRRTMATRPPRRTEVPGRDKFLSAAGVPEIPKPMRKKRC